MREHNSLEAPVEFRETASGPAASILTFPAGLPGFRNLQEFEMSYPADLNPLVCLQCSTQPYTRFLLIPADLIDRNYSLKMEPWDSEIVCGDAELPADCDLAVYFVLSIHQDGAATANMLAPIVVRKSTGTGVQAVRSDSVYSYTRPLLLERVEAT